jgi:hypothetical protein
MTRSFKMCSGAAVVALGLTFAGAASAKPDAEQDPAVGGGANNCWGDVASGTAQLDEQASMGRHSMSTQAANKQDGFAANLEEGDNGFGITFNVKEDGGNAGRQGVGNVSASFGPGGHDTHPGDGGNGVHAENNASASETLDPVTGDFGGLSGDQTLGCDDNPPEVP